MSAQVTLLTSVKSWWPEFRDGLLQPSMPALLIALATCASILGAIAWRVTESAVRNSPMATWMRDSTDECAYTTVQILRGPPAEAEVWALVGASDLRCAMPVHSECETRLGTALGRPVAVKMLTLSAMCLEEQFAVVARFGSGFRGGYVLCLKRELIKRDLRDHGHPLRLGFSSPESAGAGPAAGHPVPLRTGIFALDQVSWTRRMGRPQGWRNGQPWRLASLVLTQAFIVGSVVFFMHGERQDLATSPRLLARLVGF